MIAGFSSPLGLNLPFARLRTLLLVWFAAELVAFVLAVKLLGFGGAILLGAATTVVGIIRLQRIGFRAIQTLRSGMAAGVPPAFAAQGNALAGLGAVLMILPGFVSDAVGFALTAPSAQRAFLMWLGGSPTAPGRPAARPARATSAASSTAAPGIIDLGPEDWRVVDKP